MIAGFMVPLELLRCEWPPNDGLMPGDPYFDGIVESIRQEGIREPLTIKLDWTVIDGAHRFFAAHLLGLAEVPVVVWTGRALVARQEATRQEADRDPKDPEPITNETESGYARRRDLVAQARIALNASRRRTKRAQRQEEAT